MQDRDALRDRFIGEISRLQNQLNGTEMHRNSLAQAQDTLRNQLERQATRIAESEVSRVIVESERDMLRERLQRQDGEKAVLALEILALHASRSRRLARPLRALG